MSFIKRLLGIPHESRSRDVVGAVRAYTGESQRVEFVIPHKSGEHLVVVFQTPEEVFNITGAFMEAMSRVWPDHELSKLWSEDGS
jgi:hypothetical protein